MLATAGPVPSGPGWTAEFKWDGMRIVAASGAGGWRASTRTGRDASASFPDLNVLPELLNGRAAVLDGELVALDPRGMPNFGLLQQRHGARQPSTALVRQVPLKLYVFDLLHLDGESTVAVPYAQRRALLSGLRLDGPVVVTPPAFPDATEDVHRAAVDQGVEGVVCKRTDSLYEPGRRSRSWIKTVIGHVTDAVVCGWLPGAGRLLGTVGALVLGAYNRSGELQYVGRVGTGMSNAERRRLQDELGPLHRTGAPVHAEAAVMAAANWVEPVLVASISYREWTSTHLLRHPAWRGLAVDRQPTEVFLPDDAE
jgi:bifunctional non-homologous end joining protein LigD